MERLVYGLIGLWSVVMSLFGPSAPAHCTTAAEARAAAIHPITTAQELSWWLSRVPATKDYPPSFAEEMRAFAKLNRIEMSSRPGCLACDAMWARLVLVQQRYGIKVSVISENDAKLRAGRLGMPWVGSPIVWLRPVSDDLRSIPIAVGVDHAVNVSRNAYLASKMLTGVKPAVAVRGMSKFTGIVAGGRR